MKKSIGIICVLLALVAIGVVVVLRTPVKTVRAVGDLNVLWGVPDGDPIFSISNFLPGDVENRTVEVINGASSARMVYTKGMLTPPSLLSGALEITVSENGTDIYGGSSGTGIKTLDNFFTQSASSGGIILSTMQPGTSTHFTFSVRFPPELGNDYQNTSIVFDIIFGIVQVIPDECNNLEFNDEPIYGTSGNDTIQGTSGNDLIFGLEGDDTILGRSASDCIVGGSGDDLIDAGSGADILVGDEGNDVLKGRSGNDTLIGGPGDDSANGDSGTDTCDAEAELLCEL